MRRLDCNALKYAQSAVKQKRQPAQGCRVLQVRLKASRIVPVDGDAKHESSSTVVGVPSVWFDWLGEDDDGEDGDDGEDEEDGEDGDEDEEEDDGEDGDEDEDDDGVVFKIYSKNCGAVWA